MLNELMSLPSMEVFNPGDNPATMIVRRRKWIERFNIVTLNIQDNKYK